MPRTEAELTTFYDLDAGAVIDHFLGKSRDDINPSSFLAALHMGTEGTRVLSGDRRGGGVGSKVRGASLAKVATAFIRAHHCNMDLTLYSDFI